VRAFQGILAAGATIVVAATIAGYAGAASPQLSALRPHGASDAAQSSILKSGLSQSRLLALQLAGKLAAPVPPAVLRRQLQAVNGPRPKLAFHAGAQVGIWAANTNFNYLVGQSANGKKTVTAVDLSVNSCYSPVALKVDHGQNVWVGCELTSDSSTNGAAQEYSSTGTFEARYVPACPGNVKNCSTFSALPWDTGIDPSGNIFASLNLFSIETCQTSCNTTLGGGFEWWSGSNPSALPQLITLTESCAPVCGVGFMDIDGAGNLWFTFSGYNASNTYGFGLGEVTNPTKKPKFTIVEPIGTYGFFGGVYVSGAGTTLNVIDQKAATISQYHLPLAPSGTPFNVIGPIPQNAFGVGDPVSGGFDASDKQLAIGDTGGWLDIGKAAKNKWSLVASPNFYSGLEGASYSPSDK
jgi:hypothetical protein